MSVHVSVETAHLKCGVPPRAGPRPRDESNSASGDNAVVQVYYVKPTDNKPKAVKFIENLSVANGDHVVNGIDFAHNGHLLVAVGSQTNAGIPGALGLLPVRHHPPP